MSKKNIYCKVSNCKQEEVITDLNTVDNFLFTMKRLYNSTTAAGDNAAQYWANIAIKSKHPLAPLANVPGVFAALWTPEVAPTTAITLATAGYGFIALPKNLAHFTTITGAQGISSSGLINATRFGLFGPGVYMTKVGRPLNLFVQAKARTSILLKTPNGTARIIPYLVYVRWGAAPIILP